MITGYDELEDMPITELFTHSVVESEYTYEHINSGLQYSLIFDKIVKIAVKLKKSNISPTTHLLDLIPGGVSHF